MVPIKPDLIIFSDATVIDKYRSSGYECAGYGSVILNSRTTQYITLNGVIPGTSISFGEAWAIYQSLRYVEHIRKRSYGEYAHLRVLVITDSKVTVDTFNDFIINRWDISDWYNWKRSNKKSVKNQYLYRNIWKVINNGFLIVRFVHLRSHSKNSPKIREQIAEDLKRDRIRINSKTLDSFIKMNELADKAAKKAVKDLYEQDIPRLITSS